jgi:hypothetical protein
VIYYVEYLDWFDCPASFRLFRRDVFETRKPRRKRFAFGVAFKMERGALVASHLIVRNENNQRKYLPLSQQEAELLVPLSTRERLYDEAIATESRLGITPDK